MSFQIVLAVDKPRLSIVPGASDQLGITVRNLTTLVDEVALRLEGIDPSWVEIVPAHVPVFGSNSSTASAVIRLPRTSALAGAYTLSILAASQQSPGQEGSASAELEVQLSGEYRAALETAQGSGAQEAAYSIKVQNQSNAPLALTFRGSDPENALWYKFEPLQLTVQAGETGATMLTVRAKQWASQPQRVAFDVLSEGSYLLRGGAHFAAQPQHVAGEFLQSPAPTLSLRVRPVREQDEQGLFEIDVANPGLSPVTVELTMDADPDELEFSFQPPRLILPAQGEGRAMLRLRAVRPGAAGQPGVYQLSVAARPRGESDAVRPATATFTWRETLATPTPQPAPIPWLWLLLAVVLIALLLALVLYLAGNSL